jgi:hypothetical protein
MCEAARPHHKAFRSGWRSIVVAVVLAEERPMHQIPNAIMARRNRKYTLFREVISGEGGRSGDVRAGRMEQVMNECVVD